MQSSIQLQEVNLSIPTSDLSLLKQLAKKMVWTLQKKKRSNAEIALKEAEEGKLYKAKDLDDLFHQLDL